MKEKHVKYVCEKSMFKPVDFSNVRWADDESDYEPMREFISDFGNDLFVTDWLSHASRGYTFCAVFNDDKISSRAAILKHTDTAWEVAAVATRKAVRNQGFAKQVVSYITEHILRSGRVAILNTAEDNIAMRKTVESLGFILENPISNKSER